MRKNLTVENQERRANRARQLGVRNTNSYWANNSEINKRIKFGAPLPDGWVRGKLQQQRPIHNSGDSGRADLHV
jgi:hypothetical protein